MKLLFILGDCVMAALCIVGTGAVLGIIAIHMYQANENFQEIFQKFLKGFRIPKKIGKIFEKKFPKKNPLKKI